MLAMDKVHDIRFRYFVKGENISQIADALHLDWKTVQKYVDKTDFNKLASKPASKQRFCPKLDPYKSTIDKWLEEDKQAPRKQRHTAKRVFNRLKKEFPGFNCSYRTVANYYAVKHKEFFNSTKGYLQLFYGENMECLLEGLDAIFRHIGVVPEELWFDNTKTIITKVLRGGGRETTERFDRFQEH